MVRPTISVCARAAASVIDTPTPVISIVEERACKLTRVSFADTLTSVEVPVTFTPELLPVTLMRLVLADDADVSTAAGDRGLCRYAG